jgi:translation initiation factor 5B
MRRASIGSINKKDIMDAESNWTQDPLLTVILGFNVDLEEDVAVSDKVKIIKNVIIYKIIEEYEVWLVEQKRKMEERKLDELVRPCKLQVLPNYVFRQSNPAICGVEIVEGKLRVGNPLMKSGRAITSVRSIQLEKENVQTLEKGKQAAISMDSVTIGRQIDEGDFLFTAIPEEDFRKLKEYLRLLSKQEIELLKTIADMMREINPVWGV